MCRYHLAPESESYLGYGLHMRQVLLKLHPYVHEAKYITLRKISGAIMALLYQQHEVQFYTQLQHLPLQAQHNTVTQLSSGPIPDLARNVALFHKAGKKGMCGLMHPFAHTLSLSHTHTSKCFQFT